MHKFTDNRGREWSLALNVAAVKLVRKALNIDLLNIEAVARAFDDPITMTDVLYVLCRQQAEAAGVTDEQFGEGLAGDTLLAATGALRAALIDFLPTAQGRAALSAVFARGDVIAETLAARLQERLDSLDVDALLVAAAAKEAIQSIPRATE